MEGARRRLGERDWPAGVLSAARSATDPLHPFGVPLPQGGRKAGAKAAIALPPAEPSAETQSRPWPLAARLAFRFCFVYFSLFCLTTQVLDGLIQIPKVGIPELYTLPPIKPIVEWTAHHVFLIATPLVETDSGSGDKIFDWITCVLYLAVAGLAALIWSVLDRKRLRYDAFAKWFRLFLRFALAGQMMLYGFDKIFPMQMSLQLQTFLEPYGHLSPASVLWWFIGSSPAYEIVCGSVEFLCAVLLIVPRTALLGSLLTAGVAAQIFILNMTYDIPVKLLSFHLMLIALFLAAPEFSRISRFFLGRAAVEPSRQPSLFRSSRANRVALWAQIVFGLWLIGNTIYGSYTEWFQYGGGAPKSALYGIWNVDKLVIDNHERSPLLGDYGRWRYLIFDYPKGLNYQRMDDSFGGFDAEIDTKTQTIALTKEDDKKWKGNLHYQRPTPDHLTLDGSLGPQSMHLDLTLVDHSKLMLVSRGFHWVQEYPFYR